MKRCYIVQPGRIGDIIIVLPIARYYADNGYEVYWFVFEQFLQMFECVDYVKPIPLFCGSLISKEDIMIGVESGALATYYKIEHEISLTSDDLVVDLSVGFSGSKVDTEWKNSGFSFDEWKYAKANVPFAEKYKLKVNENLKKEKILSLNVGVGPESFYSVTHSAGRIGTFKFEDAIKRYNVGPKSKFLTFVEIRKVQGFTIFDWIDILRHAKWVYCVDSCTANLVNQLGLCKGRRVFRPWHGCYSSINIPKMDKDWIIL